MHELGNVQHAVQGMRALEPSRIEMPDPTQKTATKTIQEHDALSAVHNSWHLRDILPTSENSMSSVYSEPSKYVKWLRNEIKKINAYDGFLLGIHDKIDKFEKHTRFTLKQILDVEKYNAELYDNLELYKFTLRRIQADALKVLRCQGNIDPQRVLHLLKNSNGKPNATNKTTEHQTTSISI